MKKKILLTFLLLLMLMIPTVSVSAEEIEPTTTEISVDEPVIEESITTEQFEAVLSTATSPLAAYTNGFGNDGSYQAATYRNGYYEISNAGQLYWFAEQVNAGNNTINARLTADITINSGNVHINYGTENTSYRKWKTIGSNTNAYSGTFDGNGHSISGLYYYCANASASSEWGAIGGMFHKVNGKICNLTIAKSYVYHYSGNISSAAALCITNNGTIENCTVNTTRVVLNNNADGFLAYENSTDAIIRNCSINTSIGICRTNYGTISNCTNTGSVGNISSICVYNAGTVSGCSHSGLTYTEKSDVGGICSTNAGLITDCVNSGNISVQGSATTVGGIVGRNNGIILRCSNTGNLTSGQKYLGGIAGQNDGDKLGQNMIKDCFNTGNVETTAGYCGGIAGRNTAQIVGCYHANGNIYVGSTSSTGFLCGQNAVAKMGSGSTSYTLTGTIRNSLFYFGSYSDSYAIGTSDSGSVSQNVYNEYRCYSNAAYLLNGYTSNGEINWYQNIDNGKTADEYPVLDSSHGTVYQYSGGYSNYPPENHQHTQTKTTAAKDPTCTVDGKSESIQCLLCREYLKSAVTIPATGHTEGDWIIDVEPTANQVGSRHTECSVCGETVRSEEVTWEDLHTCTLVEQKGTSATCTENGVATCWQCKECEAYYANSDGTSPLSAPQILYATGHTSGNWIIDKEPTKTEEGLRHADCSVCGQTIKTETIPVLTSYIAQGYAGNFIDWALDEDGTLILTPDYYGCTMSDYTNGSAPWYSYRNQIKAVVIKNSVNNIGNYAFADCTKLKSVQMNDNTGEIGAHAFQNCTALESVYIGHISSKTSTIEEYAFYGCTSLHTVSFAKTSTIGNSAFSGCTALKSIYLNTSWHNTWAKPEITTGTDAFRGVSAKIYYDKSPSGSPAELTGHGGTIAFQPTTNGTCGFDNTWSFSSATGKLTISGTGKPMQYWSGDNVPWANLKSGITSIVVEEGITDLPSYLFEYSVAVETVSLPTTLKTMAFNAFNDCEKLNNLLIPASVKSTSEKFNRCYALTDVYYLGTAEEWAEVENAASAIDKNYDNDITVHLLTLHEDPPTCLEGGTESYYTFESPTVYTDLYDLNKQVITAPKPLPATGHTEVIIPAVEATCTSTGWSEGKYCSVCEAELVAQTLIPKEDHTLTETRTEPTCSKNGTLITQCSNCPYGETSILPKLGHDYVETVTAPTCTERGYTTHTCSRCKDSYIDTYTSSSGHIMGNWTQTKAPTCSTGGEETRTCNNCSYSEKNTLAELGHNYTSTITSPTCTEQGYTTHTCSRCSDTYKDSYVDSAGHSYSNWSYIKAPTCIKAGSETRSCGICSLVETREAPALGHAYETVVKEPTCTNKGYTTHTCSRCGDSYMDNYTDYANHSMTEWEVLKPATCSSAGTETRYCTVCGHEEEQEIEKRSHEMSDWTETLAPTCTEEGQESSSCANCPYTETRPLNKLSHTYQDVITPPTCKEQGYTTHTCLRCGDTYTDTYVSVANHVEEIIPGVAPTCIETGLTDGKHCTVCGTVTMVQTELPAKGHTVVNGICTNCQIYGICGNNLNWKFDSATGTLTINGTGEMYNWKYFSDVPWHKYRSAIKAAILPESLLSIGDCAFSNTGMTSISLPNGLQRIGESAFLDCKVTSVVIPESVTEIEAYAFRGCQQMESIHLPSTLTLISDYTFEGCFALKEITIPETVTSIGYRAFDNCTALEELVLPESVTSIGEESFDGCTSLKSVTIKGNVTTIHKNTFSYCDVLETVALPASIETIKNDAFDHCKFLKDVYYDGLEAEWNMISIGTGNENLTNATIHFKDPCEEGHTEVIDKAVKPTCTETGLTEGKHCSICNTVLVSQSVLPAAGHTFTETFQWADDLSSATAVLTCHCGHSEEQPCELIWDNSQSSRLTVTATLEMNEQTFSESKEISAVKEGNSITLTFDAVYSGLKISAAAYNNNGQMTAYKTPETIGKAVTLAISGDQIHIFFMTEKYCPISSFLQF